VNRAGFEMRNVFEFRFANPQNDVGRSEQARSMGLHRGSSLDIVGIRKSRMRPHARFDGDLESGVDQFLHVLRYKRSTQFSRPGFLWHPYEHAIPR